MPPFDQSSTVTDFERISARLSPTDDRDAWMGRYEGLALRTALQPIFSISHKRIVGYEALIRAYDNDASPVLPPHLFELAQDHPSNLLLDRLCRTLHVRNFQNVADEINWLFLNVSPQCMASGMQADAFFGSLLQDLQFPAHRVVVEIVEKPSDDPNLLRRTVEYYRSLGCLTAIDDFGAGHSNFERIWNLRPDIVKLDRQMLARATEEKRTRQILKGIVSLLHESGCLVLMEGVESRDQALIAVDAGVDFVQGFYFHRPTTELGSAVQGNADFETLLEQYKRDKQQQSDPTQTITSFFSHRFERVISFLQAGSDFGKACEPLVNHHTVSRCYLIGDDGVQVHDSMLSPESAHRLDPRFRPLENTSEADWYRQHYLRRALRHPGELQITRPYLSATGAHMCITLSRAFVYGDRSLVLCCDILTGEQAGD
ncbi:EAL domain-containing protein [Salicola sp. Rm-C-2C1-2]|uniref:EAL domain-containing protein n=1 Tax=Salicola sp. Rm-C-2C1-2 TaxID=3141321 RepID=UPI0032E3DCD2